MGRRRKGARASVAFNITSRQLAGLAGDHSHSHSNGDDREHEEDNPIRKTPRGEPYEPWHDASMMMEGDIADALSELGRDRWIRAGGTPLLPIQKREESLWPKGLEATFEDVEIGIARTRAEYRDWKEVREIEALFEQHGLSFSAPE